MPFREVSKVGERHEFVMLGRHDEAFALNDSATFWYYDGLGLASRAVSATLSRTWTRRIPNGGPSKMTRCVDGAQLGHAFLRSRYGAP